MITMNAQTSVSFVVQHLIPKAVRARLIGSAMYLPTPSDIDVLVQVLPSTSLRTIHDTLCDKGFTSCSNYDEQFGPDQGETIILRDAFLNLIVTRNEKFYERFGAAMEVCKALTLTEKVDRVTVCKIVRDGMNAVDARRDAEEYMAKIATRNSSRRADARPNG